MEENKAIDAVLTAETPQTPEEPDYKALYEQEKAEREKLKLGFDKASSDTAEYKRKLAEHLTAEEKAKMDREQADKELREELEKLRNERRVSNYTSKLIGVGLPAETATSLASDLPNGISDQFFDGIKKFIADKTAEIRAEALKQQPTPSVGMPLNGAPQKSEYDKRLDRAFGL